MNIKLSPLTASQKIQVSSAFIVFIICFVAIVVFIAFDAFGGEADELKKDLAVVQSQMAEERALYLAAKAAIERSEIVAKYLFPILQAREQDLTQKIQRAESKGEKK